MLRDVVLLGVIFGSAAIAVAAPEIGAPFQPFLMKFLMALLFLGFTRIDFKGLFDTSRQGLQRLGILVVIKLIMLPVLLFWVTSFFSHDYAVPVMLLSGISTGVVAPFMAALVAAEVATVIRMVVVTSVLVPISLPFLVELLVGTEISIPFTLMVETLAWVIFLPLLLVAVVRKLAPRLLNSIHTVQFPLSLCLFALINLGVFSKHSHFFIDHSTEIVAILLIAYLLSAVYFAVGYLALTGAPQEQRFAAGISLALMNNVLVIVFSSEFFGPLSPALATMYLFPFFSLLTPLRILANTREKQCSGN
jgi:BASS family bile acid:Na+ symporter